MRSFPFLGKVRPLREKCVKSHARTKEIKGRLGGTVKSKKGQGESSQRKEKIQVNEIQGKVSQVKSSHLVLRKKGCDAKSRRRLVPDAVGDLQHKHVTPTAVVDTAVVAVSDRTNEQKLKQHRVGARRDDVSDVDVDNVALEGRQFRKHSEKTRCGRGLPHRESAIQQHLVLLWRRVDVS